MTDQQPQREGLGYLGATALGVAWCCRVPARYSLPLPLCPRGGAHPCASRRPLDPPGCVAHAMMTALCGEWGKRAYLTERSVFGLPASAAQRYRQDIYSVIYLPAGSAVAREIAGSGGEIGPTADARRAA